MLAHRRVANKVEIGQLFKLNHYLLVNLRQILSSVNGYSLFGARDDRIISK